MRKLFLFLSAAALAASLRAGAFEGSIDYQLTAGEKKPMTIHYDIKNPRIRAVIQAEKGKEGVMIMEPASRTMWILNAEQKMAIKQTLPEPKAVADAGAPHKGEFKKTGRKETVAGRDCVIYAFSDENSDGEVCNAEGMGHFMFTGLGGGSRPGASAWEKEAMSKGLFPLKVVNKNRKDGKTMMMVAVKIEAKSLPATAFQVPADYKVMEGFGMPSPMAGSKGAPAAVGGGGSQDMMKKMMSASPEEREKMIEQMRKTYGDGK